jgi:SAM-dependent methyltransferase
VPTGPLSSVDTIIGTLWELQPRRVLDVGMGTGKWGFLLRDRFDLAENRPRSDWVLTIDGVEGYAPYLGDHQRAVYDTVHIGEAQAFLAGLPNDSYDVALALDILEHFPPADGVTFIAETLRVATYTVISTPKRWRPQRWEENPLEDHQSWWPRKAIRQVAKHHNAMLSMRQSINETIAVLSLAEKPPKIRDTRLIEVASMIRGAVIPELFYYRLRGKTGPALHRHSP